jgi:hypothetical protein
LGKKKYIALGSDHMLGGSITTYAISDL